MRGNDNYHLGGFNERQTPENRRLLRGEIATKSTRSHVKATPFDSG